MTTEHPITPPLKLMQQWATEYWGNPGESIGEGEKYIATQAARWGADEELEACLDQLRRWGIQGVENLRNTRRPKPPSLAEQAIAELDVAVIRGDCITTSDAIPSLRAALKRLQELEEGSE